MAGNMRRVKKFLKSLFPVTVFERLNQVRFYFLSVTLTQVTLWRLASRSSDIRVNVGCGGKPTPNWINLDIIRHPAICFWDCRYSLPFKDKSVAAIYAEHFLEHMEYSTEARRFLEECLRCLKPKGILRLVVPDAGEYLKGYVTDSWDAIATRRPLVKENDRFQDFWLHETYSTKMEFINSVFRQGGKHKYAYDSETLIALLDEIGFSEVEERAFNSSSDEKLTIDSPERRSESLYIEGKRP